MSRIAKNPIIIPEKTSVDISNDFLNIKGNHGEINFHIPVGFKVEKNENLISVKTEKESLKEDPKWGTLRANLANAVKGVSEGYSKKLEINGVGYRAQKEGSDVTLLIGYSHPVIVKPLEGIQLEVEGQNRVIVRGIDKEALVLRFHTDKRSKKVEQININQNALIHIYSQHDKLQLRFKSNLTLHINGELVDDAWEKSYGMSKICYQVGDTPGSAIESPDAYKYLPEVNNDGKDNFIVILAKIIEIEWLYLSCDGHQRAKFTHNKSNELEVTWLVP